MSGRKPKRPAEAPADAEGDSNPNKRQRRPSSKIADYNDAEIDAFLKAADEDAGPKRSKKAGRAAKAEGEAPQQHAEPAPAQAAPASSAPDGSVASADAASTKPPMPTMHDVHAYQQYMKMFQEMTTTAATFAQQSAPIHGPAATTAASVAQQAQIAFTVLQPIIYGALAVVNNNAAAGASAGAGAEGQEGAGAGGEAATSAEGAGAGAGQEGAGAGAGAGAGEGTETNA